MRNRLGMLLGAVIALVMVASLSDDASAGKRKMPRGVKELLQATTFSDVGEYTGAVEGEMTINGTFCRLAPDAIIYEIGRGVVPTGTSFSNRVVAVSGVIRGNLKIVHQVIVRPEQTMFAINHNSSEFVEVNDKERPR